MPKYYNTTFGSLVWNDNGQIVGGKEWLVVDEPTAQIVKYLETSEMVLVQEPEPQEKPRRTRRSKQNQEESQE
jgi:hypothetical protein